jgi:hypothetical protein
MSAAGYGRYQSNLLRCMSRQVTRSRTAETSAIWSLTDGKRTRLGHCKSEAFGPKRTQATFAVMHNADLMSRCGRIGFSVFKEWMLLRVLDDQNLGLCPLYVICNRAPQVKIQAPLTSIWTSTFPRVACE